VGFAQPIQSNIDVKLEIGILRKAMLRDFVNSMRLETIRRQIDVANTIVPDEEIDDFRQFFPERRLAAAEPQIGEWRCVLRKLHDLVPRQIALLVQLVPIETRLAGRVAMRSDEENDRVQLSPAGEPPNTRVSFGETSL